MNTIKKLITSIVVVSLLFLCFIGKGRVLNLGKREIIKSAGLSVIMFNGFKSRPISFPNQLTRKADKNNKYYKTVDIWRYKQYVGRWGNNDGSLTIAEMSFLPPTASPGFIAETQSRKKFNAKGWRR